MQAGVTVSFYGVRGSTPCHCSSMARVGGNTSCVVVQRDGEKPIICDAGTGLRFFGTIVIKKIGKCFWGKKDEFMKNLVPSHTFD